MPGYKIALFYNLLEGGAQRVVFDFTRMLSLRHSVDLYSFSFTSSSALNNPEHFALHSFKYECSRLHLPPPIGFLSPVLSILNLWRLDRVYKKMAFEIDRKGYDLVFVHGSFADYFHHPGILKYLRTRCVYYCQESSRSFFERDMDIYFLSVKEKIVGWMLWPALAVYRQCFKAYDAGNVKRNSFLTLCNSRYSAADLEKRYGIKAKVNYLGVDTKKFYFMPEVAKENVVLSVGHLALYKRHDFIIQSVAALPEQARPCVYFVCPAVDRDTLDYKNFLEKFAVDLGVSIRFFTAVSDKELCRLYNLAKVTVCFSQKEPFGLAAIESMASQTPVIAVNEGGYVESVLHNETGILVEREVSAAAKALTYLLSHDDIREKLGAQARNHVMSHFSLERSVEELENNFGLVISRRL